MNCNMKYAMEYAVDQTGGRETRDVLHLLWCHVYITYVLIYLRFIVVTGEFKSFLLHLYVVPTCSEMVWDGLKWVPSILTHICSIQEHKHNVDHSKSFQNDLKLFRTTANPKHLMHCINNQRRAPTPKATTPVRLATPPGPRQLEGRHPQPPCVR